MTSSPSLTGSVHTLEHPPLSIEHFGTEIINKLFCYDIVIIVSTILLTKKRSNLFFSFCVLVILLLTSLDMSEVIPFGQTSPRLEVNILIKTGSDRDQNA